MSYWDENCRARRLFQTEIKAPRAKRELDRCANWNVIRDYLRQIQLAARIVDINPNQVAFFVVIQYDSLGHLSNGSARPRRKINV